MYDEDKTYRAAANGVEMFATGGFMNAAIKHPKLHELRRPHARRTDQRRETLLDRQGLRGQKAYRVF